MAVSLAALPKGSQDTWVNLDVVAATSLAEALWIILNEHEAEVRIGDDDMADIHFPDDGVAEIRTVGDDLVEIRTVGDDVVKLSGHPHPAVAVSLAALPEVLGATWVNLDVVAADLLADQLLMHIDG